jgi:hypothetical protein
MMQKESFERLKKAMDVISNNPKTAAEVSLLFEEFVASIEEIACDLATISDEQVAENLKECVSAIMESPSMDFQPDNAPS